MEELISLGIYLGIGAGILGAIFLITFLKRKFNIKTEELDLAHNIIDLVIYLAKKSDFKYSGDIATVARYVFLAIAITEKYETTDSIDEKKELVSEEALLICEDNGIVLNQEIIGLVNEIVDYFVH